MSILIHTDGGSRGNPGPAAIGVVIETPDKIVIEEFAEAIGFTTNNVAEYSAVIAALEWLKKNRSSFDTHNANEPLQFFLDSSLVVNQLNGLFKIKDAKLRDLLWRVRLLEQEIGRRITYAYIPREKNTNADRLVNKALDK